MVKKVDRMEIISGSIANRVGIMGGTFDPIHYGHLVTAEAARHEFNLDQVIFIPAGQPPHKDKQIITEPHHRFKMTALATESNNFFQTSLIEINREGPSFTIDTVRALKNINPVSKIYFITGADAVLELITWKDIDQLAELCTFIAATRPGYNLSDKINFLPENYLNKIKNIIVPALAISSTDIRARVKKDKPIKYLLPENVEDYIFCHHLYK